MHAQKEAIFEESNHIGRTHTMQPREEGERVLDSHWREDTMHVDIDYCILYHYIHWED